MIVFAMNVPQRNKFNGTISHENFIQAGFIIGIVIALKLLLLNALKQGLEGLFDENVAHKKVLRDSHLSPQKASNG